jgi:uncharacterized protein YeaO (DUF488 family)
MSDDVRYRRIYDSPASDDGLRVLVDRIWPRGIRKDDADFDEWIKDVAPSTELRQWFGHDPQRYAEFRRRYLAELRDPQRKQAGQHIREASSAYKRTTLLTAARDPEHSHVAVLAHWLNTRKR